MNASVAVLCVRYVIDVFMLFDLDPKYSVANVDALTAHAARGA